MPSSLIYAIVLTCERVLVDKDDDTTSAIRMIDILLVPPEEERSEPVLLISVLGLARFLESETSDHQFRFELERPSGERKFIGEPLIAREPRSYSDAPSGISLRLQLPVAARELGIHWIHLWVDNEKVASAPFTLLAAGAERAGGPKQQASSEEGQRD